MATTAYLDEDDQERVKKIQDLASYDSISEVVGEALKIMERELVQEKLAEKYRNEPHLEDDIEGIQAEAASDLGDYDW
ncbi:MAG: hypothetical protein ABEK50_00055 [bacterium]